MDESGKTRQTRPKITTKKGSMAEKKKQSVLTKVQVVLAVLAVAGLGYLGWKGAGYFASRSLYSSVREAYANEATETINFDALTANYPNAVAWIHFDSDELAIDYPVIKGDDNEFYLRHDLNGNYSTNGTIFLDYRNNSLAEDLHTLIYGHNMLDGSMFSNLSKFTDQEFYTNETSTFWIATPEATYHYQIFAVSIVDPYSDAYTVGYKDAASFDAFVQQLKKASLYDTGVSASGSDHVVTLSTCSRPNRLVVSAKLVGED